MEYENRNKSLQKSKKPTNEEEGGITASQLQQRLDFYRSRMEAEQAERKANADDSPDLPEEIPLIPEPKNKVADTPQELSVPERFALFEAQRKARREAQIASETSNDRKVDVGETKKPEESLGIDGQLLSGKTDSKAVSSKVPIYRCPVNEEKEETDRKQTEAITAKTDKEDKEKSDEKQTNDTKKSDKTTPKVAPIESKIGNPPTNRDLGADSIGTSIKSAPQSTPDGGTDKDTKKAGSDAGAGGGGRMINMVHKQFDGLDAKLSVKVDSQKTLVKDSLRKATAPGMAKNKKAIEKTKKEEKRKTPTVVKLKEVKDAEVIPQKAADTEKAQENVKGLSKKEVKKTDKGAIGQAKDKLGKDMAANLPKTKEDLEDEKVMEKFNAEAGEQLDELFETVGAKTSEVSDDFKEINNPGLGETPRIAKQLPDLEKAKNTDLVSVEDLQKKVPDEQFKPIINEARQGSIDTLKKEGIGEGEAISYEDFKQAKSEDLRRGIDAHENIQEETTRAPGDIRKHEKQKHDALGKAVRDREQTKRNQMRASRDEQLRSGRGNQTRAKSDFEVQRAAITAKMDEVFNTARTTVTERLNKLDTEVKLRFDTAKKKALETFSKNVESKLSKFHQERYVSSKWNIIPAVLVVNLVRWAFEDTSKLPEVLAIFEEERQVFVNAIDREINLITAYVENEVEACKKIIDAADAKLEEIAKAQGPAFKKVTDEAYKRIRKKLDKLDSDVDKKAAELKKYLEAQRKKAIADVDKKISEMKEKLKGLLNRVGKFLLDAAYKFFKWVLSSNGFSTEQIDQVINQGREVLTKIVTDPMGFLKNLISAVGQGFNNSVGNIGTHLQNGLFSWLTGAMSQAGLVLPQKWDMKGIFSVVLQVMGLSWANIRAKIAKEVGEDALAKAEEATDAGLEIFQQIKAKGFVDAMWDMLVEKAGMIQQMVIDEVKNWLIVKVVQQAVTKILSMLNPAGAIVQAILAVFNFAMWLINNWERIVGIIKNIVSSVGKIALGQLGEASKFIETTLANFVPVLIDFLARLIGLGNVSERVKKIIMRMRKPVDDLIAKIIRFIKGKLRGFGKKGKKPDSKKRQSEVDPRTHKEKEKAVKKAAKEAQKVVDNDKIPMKEVKEKLQKIKSAHGLKELELKLIRTKKSVETYRITAQINPKETEEADREKNLTRPVLEKNTVIKHTLGRSTAFPLTSKRNGNSSTTDIDGWDHASKLNAAFGKDKNGDVGRRGVWVKGHIIHHGLGGDGTDPSNLFIIDKTANSDMKTIEHKVVEMLKALIKLTDPKDKNYNKVMFYDTSYTMHGKKTPLSAFANNIAIRYGTMDIDGGNSELKRANVTSSKPSESADEVSVNINSLGRTNMTNFLSKRGLKGNYPRYLAVILRKDNYEAKRKLKDALINEDNIAEYNNEQPTKPISTKLVKSRTNELMKILDSDLNFTL